MPVGAVKTKRDEHLWSLAKRRAKEEGRSGDYAYIMGIYQHAKGAKSERLVLDLVKADSTSKAPAGFSPIANSKHGGYHKKHGAGYIYWYPGVGITSKPQEGGAGEGKTAPEKEPAKPEPEAKKEDKPPKAEVIIDPSQLPPGFNDLDKKTRAVMTADWENVQKQIEDRQGPPREYKGDLGKAVDAHIEHLGRQGYIIPSNVEKAKEMMGQMVKHGQAAGIDRQKLTEVMEENVRKLAQQETESARRTLGDHGVRHLASNARMSDAIFDQLEKGGVELDPRDRFMAYQAWIDHDMGYTTPAIAQGGFAVKDNYHPQASAVLVMQQRKKYEELFGADKFETYVQAVANHSGTAVDWKGDHFGSAIRLADNTHLFSDKMPEVMFDRPEAVECLVKIRLAQEMFPKPKDGERKPEDKAKVKAMIGGVKRALSAEIDRRDDLPPSSKALLQQAAQELGEMTPKFLISRLAGRSPEFSFKGGDMNVVIEQSDARQTIGEVFGDDEEDKQFAKLLKDYGTDPHKILDGKPPPEAHIGDKGNGINFKWEPGGQPAKDPAERKHAEIMKRVRSQWDEIQKMPEGEDRNAAMDRFFGVEVAKALRAMIGLTSELDDWLEKAERIPGGVAAGKRPEDFDQEQLHAGIKVEMEHTRDRKVAREIAMDHLTEDRHYYIKLQRMEKSSKAPAGYEPVPRSAHGGYRKRHGSGYIYWYPGKGVTTTEPHEADLAEHHRATAALLAEPKDVPRNPHHKAAEKHMAAMIEHEEVLKKLPAQKMMRADPHKEARDSHGAAYMAHKNAAIAHENASRTGNEEDVAHAAERSRVAEEASQKAAGGSGGTSEGEAEANRWKDTAKKLLDASKHEGQEGLHYRAYLRAIVSGSPSQHLTAQFEGARMARADLIDERGKLGKSAMTAVAERTGRERPSPYKPVAGEHAEEKKPGLLHRIAAKLGKRPPGSGWSPIPGGAKGGFRKMGPGGYVYWYPGMGAQGGTQEQAERHVKTEAAKKEIQHHDTQSDKWRERSAKRQEQGHPHEAVEAARSKMHEHANQAEKLRKEHNLQHWRRSASVASPEDDRIERGTARKAKAPLIKLDKEGVGKMPKLKPHVEPDNPPLPEAHKSVRMGSVDLGLSSDEYVCKAMDGGMELGVGARHYDQPRRLNVDMMKGTIYQGEAALPNQADDREAFMRQQVLDQTLEDDAAGNQGNGGDPAWFGFMGAAVPPTTVVDDSDPMVRQAFRKRD
ncbi:MAG: hypothetical protein MUC88_00135 [Planctomycetes bacterium]|jgi:hypothetical protein|nr:hypothetical protein [Planctomycetota bacterium]